MGYLKRIKYILLDKITQNLCDLNKSQIRWRNGQWHYQKSYDQWDRFGPGTTVPTLTGNLYSKCDQSAIQSAKYTIGLEYSIYIGEYNDKSN